MLTVYKVVGGDSVAVGQGKADKNICGAAFLFKYPAGVVAIDLDATRQRRGVYDKAAGQQYFAVGQKNGRS